MNKKLAQVVVEDMNKKVAKKQLLKQIDKNTWEYITNKYDFEVSGHKGIFAVDIFKHKVEDNDEAYIESAQFDNLEDAENFVRNYK